MSVLPLFVTTVDIEATRDLSSPQKITLTPSYAISDNKKAMMKMLRYGGADQVDGIFSKKTQKITITFLKRNRVLVSCTIASSVFEDRGYSIGRFFNKHLVAKLPQRTKSKHVIEISAAA